MTTANKNKIGAVVLDFDGTMTDVEVCDAIMGRFTSNWQAIGQLHDDGDISHAELNRRFLSLLHAKPDEVSSFLCQRKWLREGAAEFLARVKQTETPVLIASGGWDFYIRIILENEVGSDGLNFITDTAKLDPLKINILCNIVDYDGEKWTIETPAKRTFLASPSKKACLSALRAIVGSQRIVFFGDGSTDYEAARLSDVVFARNSLLNHCKEVGIVYRAFDDFKGIELEDLRDMAIKPPYSSLMDILRMQFFMDPCGNNADKINTLLATAITAALKGQGKGPVYPAEDARLSSQEVIASASLGMALSHDPNALVKAEMPLNLKYGVKAGHPLMVKNIIPTPSAVFLAANTAASLYGQNGVTGEDAGEALNAELKITAVLSDMAGYDRHKSAGVFTFGGTGTNMYGIKMGLAKCCPSHGIEGISGDVYVVGSKPAHYSHVTAADWLGIGQKNYLHAKSNLDQTTDLEDLELKCREILNKGGKLACIIGVAGTTSNMAIDDFSAIKLMRDRLVESYGLEYSPHIHADSVVGWPYLYFTSYDFDRNNLGFSENALARIKLAAGRISTLKYADSFGVDFHKTGYMPYNASMVICAREADLQALGRDAKLMTPLFHEENIYNPGKVTLETSRSSANMLAAWLSMKAMGKEGYQALLGHAQEMAEIARAAVVENESLGICVANKNGYGTDVFVRCYPASTDVNEAYARDLTDDNSLAENSGYTSRFFKWLTSEDSAHKDIIAISKTSAAFYTDRGKPMVALRLYFLSPYHTEDTVKELVGILAAAKEEFDRIQDLSPNSTPRTAHERLALG